MNPMPLHPALVHLPLALAVLVPMLGATLLVASLRNWLPHRTWWLAAGMQALLLASGVIAQRTGEGDEERVERVAPEVALEAHEEAAEVFLWAAAGVLALSVLPLLLRSQRATRLAMAATTAGALVVLGLGYRVGQAGGELVYRHGAAAAFTSATGQVPELPPDRANSHRAEDDDDR